MNSKNVFKSQKSGRFCETSGLFFRVKTEKVQKVCNLTPVGHAADVDQATLLTWNSKYEVCVFHIHL